MRIVCETKQNFSMFLAARLVFVTVLLGVAALFVPAQTSRVPYWILLIANAAFSLGMWMWFRKRQPPSWMTGLSLTAAVILDTLALHYAGGADSEFVFLYFFSIGAAGLLTGLSGSLWTALLSATGVVWLYHEVAPGALEEHAVRAYLLGVNFLLTAFLTSFAFEKLRERERSHARVLRELERIRLDTQAILDALPTGVVVLDSNDEVLYWNPVCQRVLNCPDDASASAIQSTLNGSFNLQPKFEELRVNGAAEIEAEYSAAQSGLSRPVGLSATALGYPPDDLRGFIVLINDLSKQKEHERRERERENLAAIGALSRELAHEIRNPLATVRGCVEMIKLGETAESDNTQYLDLALRESDRLNNLLRDFLLYSHVSTPAKNTENLAALVRSRCVGLRDRVTIENKLPEILEAAYDPAQLTLVIDALILTLAQWGEGREALRISQNGGGMSVTFKLDNIVVPLNVRDTIFQPFADSRNRSLGLALPTAMRAVHAHGGTLSLQSEPGHGTWFELAI
jgi:two-component system sensor histidine kinase PilS (NtrC family)